MGQSKQGKRVYKCPKEFTEPRKTRGYG